MKTSLKEYHFNPEKSGKILNEWVKKSGMSCQKVADETNYSYDTMNNSLHGKIKELSLERVFKISVVTGHSVCEYLRLMLLGEDIDFADRIHVLRDAEYSLVPLESDLPSPVQKPVQTSVQPPAKDNTTPQNHELYEIVMEKAREVNQANLERFAGIHRDYLKKLETEHAAHIETVRKVARQRLKWIIILAVLLAAIVVWFIWDLTHPEIGLIRLKQMGYIGFGRQG